MKIFHSEIRITNLNSNTNDNSKDGTCNKYTSDTAL